VIAEGVETSEQLQALRDMRCQAVQGFLLDVPKDDPDVL
jgi:EAL domain-containing protein (putative c-di-GMP-specific phosphodiesterase class I)